MGSPLPLSPAGTMRLVGGHPCLDFANTVGGRVRDKTGTRVTDDKLAGYGDLLAFAVHAGLLGEREAHALRRRAAGRPREAAAVLRRARALREALHRTLRGLMRAQAPRAADLSRLAHEIAACRSHELLAYTGAGLRFESRHDSARLDSALWPVVRSAAALLTSPELERLRECAGADCGWLFLDRSRNASRQWCTMQDCGNRAKVRRFRARRSGPAASERR